MSQESFEQFRQLVLRDRDIQRRLRETPDRESFVGATLEAGAELGYSFSAEEVSEALRAGQRAWIERWLVR